ncbi:MAG: hypothetical protein GQF41_2637 [Candidatus Rifleibacterium amylolyticum]|nr:MAG: hypothetical protein GQF41_2637 [Candidatus Rifleibacterium amylolyticum]
MSLPFAKNITAIRMPDCYDLQKPDYCRILLLLAWLNASFLSPLSADQMPDLSLFLKKHSCCNQQQLCYLLSGFRC